MRYENYDEHDDFCRICDDYSVIIVGDKQFPIGGWLSAESGFSRGDKQIST